MELLLLCTALAYMIGGKFDKDKTQAAYKAGKEPPGLAKARMRHESGGGLIRKSPGGAKNQKGKPAGHGAMRLALSQRWSQACEKSQDRAADKHRRWRQWYSEQAPERDQAWRDKQSRRIEKSQNRADKFARARGIARDVAGPASRQERKAWNENTRRGNGSGSELADEDEPGGEPAIAQARDEARQLRKREQEPGTGTEDMPSQQGKAVRSGGVMAEAGPDERDAGGLIGVQDFGATTSGGGTGTEDMPSQQDKAVRSGGVMAEAGPDERDAGGLIGVQDFGATTSGGGAASDDRPDEPSAAPTATPAAHTTDQHAPSSTTTGAASAGAPTGGGMNYSSAAQTLRTAAGHVDRYRSDLSAMADGLGGKQWGVEVHGPIRDMDAALATTAGNYRDLAAQMEAQGDSVHAAEESHPYVPGDEVINA